MKSPKPAGFCAAIMLDEIGQRADNLSKSVRLVAAVIVVLS
jgi:hypothetical protein